MIFATLFKFSNYISIRSLSDMVYVLNVAEKNDAAKSISHFMSKGKMNKREGFSKFNKIFDFNCDILNQNCQMIMTSVSGHMMNFEFTGKYKKWNGCSPLELFEAPLSKNVTSNCLNIEKTLKKEIQKCKYLIIWTDCDREGENIGYEIIQTAQSVKPNLQIYRAKFSEITFKSIQRACENLETMDANINNAVDTRQEFDLRIGAAFTRFQTLRFTRRFPASLGENLISYGSCQFPTLGLVVERYKQVENFISEPFWKICLSYKPSSNNSDIEGVHKDNKNHLLKEIEFLWKRVRVFEHSACLAMYSICMENPVAKIIDIKSKPKSKWRPTAMDTIALEKLASKKLRISAKETMGLAEKLYQKGFISYPRTETNIFPKELNLRSLVEAQTSDSLWGEYAQRVLAENISGPLYPRNGTKSDKAHPPIHPIKHRGDLEGKELAIYEMITRHFLACVGRDAKGHETTVVAEVNEAESFTAKGLIVLERNYLDVYYLYESWNDKEIPNFSLGDTFTPHALEMREGTTKPPPLLTESDLISLMEKHGIGTDATHADHIETIKNRQYVGLVPLSNQDYDIARSEAFDDQDDGDDNIADTEEITSKTKGAKLKAKKTNSSVMGFLPGKLGMGLVEGYNATGYPLAKPQLRSELEKDLVAICEGTKNKDEVLKYHLDKYKQIYKEVQEKVNRLDEALAKYFGPSDDTLCDNQPDQQGENSLVSPLAVRPCPNCTSPMVLKKLASKYSYGNSNNEIVDNTSTGPKNFVLTCSNYPDCKASLWFPSHIFRDITVAETDGFCDVCMPSNQHRLVTLKLNPKNIPPMIPALYTTCLGGCDQLLEVYLNLRFSHVTPHTTLRTALTPHSTGNNSHATPVNNSTTSYRQRNNTNTSPNDPNVSIVKRSFCTTTNQTRSQHSPSSLPCIQSIAQVLQSDDSDNNNINNNIDNNNNIYYDNNNNIHYNNNEDDNYDGCNDDNFDDYNGVYNEDFESINNSNVEPTFSTSRYSKDNNTLANKNTFNHKNPFNSPAATTTLLCLCNKPAIMLTTKRGPNTGRDFYKCAAREANLQCKWFKWADELMMSQQQQINIDHSASFSGAIGSMRISKSQITSSSNNFNNFSKTHAKPSFSKFQRMQENGDGGESSDVVCSCHQKAVKRKVQKEGPNKGKDFYACPKSRDQQCNFFLWASPAPESSTSNKKQNSSSWKARGIFEDNDSEDNPQTRQNFNRFTQGIPKNGLSSQNNEKIKPIFMPRKKL